MSAVSRSVRLGLIVSLTCASTLGSVLAKPTPPVAAAPATGATEGFILNMTSNFGGVMDVYETPKAIRFNLAKLGLNVIVKAPTWEALVYNDANKSMMIVPYTVWTKRFLMSKTAKNEKNTIIKQEITKETKSILGYKAIKVKVSRVHTDEHNKTIPSAELWVAPQIKAPSQFFSMLRALGIKIEDSTGVPLKVTTFVHVAGSDKIMKSVSVLECNHAEKTKIPDSNFVTLTGYKRVTDEMALMMGDDDQDMMGGGAAADPLAKPKAVKQEDISGLFGGDFGKKKK